MGNRNKTNLINTSTFEKELSLAQAETKASNKEKRIPKNPIKYKLQLNEEQKIGKRIIFEKTVTAIIGKAGSGKTLLAINSALDLMYTRHCESIYIARPAVDAGENLGFLPGGIEEKMEPWLIPIMHNFYQCYDRNKIDKDIKDKKIQTLPVGYLRGNTILNSVLIVDECQNVTKKQMEMIIGRVGLGSKLILCGDSSQIDLKKSSDSGLNYLIQAGKNIEDFDLIELLENHRHPIVDEFLTQFELLKA